MGSLNNFQKNLNRAKKIKIEYIKDMKDTLIAETSIGIDASAAQVWKALTTPKLIKK